MNNDNLRKKIVDESLTWLNTPYYHMGTVKGHGVDCGMLLLKVISNIGIIENFDTVIKEIGFYPEDWAFNQTEERYLNQVLRFSDKIDCDPLPGDFILYKWGKTLSHGAIIIEYPKIIHAFKTYGCVCFDDTERIFLKKRIDSIYRLKVLN